VMSGCPRWMLVDRGYTSGQQLLRLVLESDGSWSFRAQALGLLAMGNAQLIEEVRLPLLSLLSGQRALNMERRRALISLREALDAVEGEGASTS
jgi:hypothetical protein